MNSNRLAWMLAALALISLATACRSSRYERDYVVHRPGPQHTVQAQRTYVTGTIVARERVIVPRDAVAYVQLVDLSRGGARGVVVAERVYRDYRGAPIRFELPYEAERLQRRGRYVVRAEVRSRDRVLYTTPASTPVVTRGAVRDVEVPLQRNREVRRVRRN